MSLEERYTFVAQGSEPDPERFSKILKLENEQRQAKRQAEDEHAKFAQHPHNVLDEAQTDTHAALGYPSLEPVKPTPQAPVPEQGQPNDPLSGDPEQWIRLEGKSATKTPASTLPQDTKKKARRKKSIGGSRDAKPNPAQPSPAQPSPAQPSPAQPSPAQPSPAQPSPAQPSPAQPSPAQPSPAQPSPAKPSPARPRSRRPSAPELANIPITRDRPVRLEQAQVAPTPVVKKVQSFVQDVQRHAHEVVEGVQKQAHAAVEGVQKQAHAAVEGLTHTKEQLQHQAHHMLEGVQHLAQGLHLQTQRIADSVGSESLGVAAKGQIQQALEGVSATRGQMEQAFQEITASVKDAAVQPQPLPSFDRTATQEPSPTSREQAAKEESPDAKELSPGASVSSPPSGSPPSRKSTLHYEAPPFHPSNMAQRSVFMGVGTPSSPFLTTASPLQRKNFLVPVNSPRRTSFSGSPGRRQQQRSLSTGLVPMASPMDRGGSLMGSRPAEEARRHSMPELFTSSSSPSSPSASSRTPLLSSPASPQSGAQKTVKGEFYDPVTGTHLNIDPSTPNLVFKHGQQAWFSSEQAIRQFCAHPRDFMSLYCENEPIRPQITYHGLSVKCIQCGTDLKVDDCTPRITLSHGQCLFFASYKCINTFLENPSMWIQDQFSADVSALEQLQKLRVRQQTAFSPRDGSRIAIIKDSPACTFLGGQKVYLQRGQERWFYDNLKSCFRKATDMQQGVQFLPDLEGFPVSCPVCVQLGVEAKFIVDDASPRLQFRFGQSIYFDTNQHLREFSHDPYHRVAKESREFALTQENHT